MLFVFLFFLVLIVIIVAFLMSQAESQTAASVPIKQELYAIGGTDLDRFFVECVLAGCTDFSQEKNIAKAKLFAEKYEINSDLVEARSAAIVASIIFDEIMEGTD